MQKGSEEESIIRWLLTCRKEVKKRALSGGLLTCRKEVKREHYQVVVDLQKGRQWWDSVGCASVDNSVPDHSCS